MTDARSTRDDEDNEEPTGEDSGELTGEERATAQDAAVVDALLAAGAAAPSDPANAPTTLDRPGDGGPDPANAPTTLDGATTVRQRSRVNLPGTLVAQFEIVRTITSGAEADVLVVREHETGDLRVVKLYRETAGPIDAKLLELLSHADDEHVVKILKRGQEDGEWWEELEYCPEGSLADLRRPDRARDRG